MRIQLASLALCLASTAAVAQDAGMTFFITSAGPGRGADLGGLTGADRHCAALAEGVGVSGREWRAYLSADGNGTPVNARDRIGDGPWTNAKGVVVAETIEALHGENNLNKATGLSESGAQVPGRGDTPNKHDILTGSTAEGMLMAGMTCGDWTVSDDSQRAIVGHFDRMGLNDTAPARSWNESHPSRGCSAAMLQATGGDGLFYCFAAD